MLLTTTAQGLYCPVGDFYIDPWVSVPKAVITHAHGDHARWGCKKYLAAKDGEHLMRTRLGKEIDLQSLRYGEQIVINGVRVSFHPAGHVLGSAQVRVEHGGHVWVASGDYKIHRDPTCRPFEPVKCHHFITESTFGMPIYRWPEPREVFKEVNQWWLENQAEDRTSVIFAYSLGKAQRVLTGIDAGLGPIFCHGAVETLNTAYRASGVRMPETEYAGRGEQRKAWKRALVVAPPSAQGSVWLRKFGEISTGFASGWMMIRGTRRRKAVDRGFVLSDHADWPGLLEAIKATGAENIYVTHGYTAQMTQWLNTQGYQAQVLQTRFTGERLDAGAEESEDFTTEGTEDTEGEAEGVREE